MADATPVVGIIMGSESDMPAMEPCMAQLDAMGVPYEVKVASAHRKPAVVHEWAETAHDRGIKVIIAAAGKAAHLGGVVAAFTPLPVIAVPMKTSDLGGLDSLLSMVQMPSGVPFVVAGSLASDFSQKIAFVSICSGAAGNLRGENDDNEGKWFNLGAESGHEARSSVSNVCRKC